MIRLAYGNADPRDLVILCERCDEQAVAVIWGEA
jgi:hypothetical protein